MIFFDVTTLLTGGAGSAGDGGDDVGLKAGCLAGALEDASVGGVLEGAGVEGHLVAETALLHHGDLVDLEADKLLRAKIKIQNHRLLFRPQVVGNPLANQSQNLLRGRFRKLHNCRDFSKAQLHALAGLLSLRWGWSRQPTLLKQLVARYELTCASVTVTYGGSKVVNFNSTDALGSLAEDMADVAADALENGIDLLGSHAAGLASFLRPITQLLGDPARDLALVYELELRCHPE